MVGEIKELKYVKNIVVETADAEIKAAGVAVSYTHLDVYKRQNPYNVGVDCAILMNPQTWVASGHLGGFSDPLMDCKSCKERFRADKLIEDYMDEHKIEHEGGVDGWSQEEMKAYIDEHDICCPKCGKKDFTDIRQFNLMFKTFQGVTEDEMCIRDSPYTGHRCGQTDRLF